MSKFKLDFEVRGLQKLFRRLSAPTKDKVLRQGLSRARAFVVKWIAERRMTGTDAGHKVLRTQTGRLKSSVLSSVKKRIIKRGKDYLAVIGTNVLYARTHEYGNPTRNIPARPFLRPGIQEKRNQIQIVKDIKYVVERALQRAR